MGLNFVAIDFETAAGPRDTACSVSLVRVRDGQIVDQYSTLINPECEFSTFNTRIHHITPEMVADSPTFPQIAPTLCDFIRDDVLVAHNAAFDVDVLRSMLRRYDLPVPEFEYLCTVQAAKAAYPDLDNYKLKTLCSTLHIPLEHHHDSMCDTCACANLLNAIAEQAGAATFEDLSDNLHMDIDFVIRRRKELARIQAQMEKEAKAAAKAAREAERAAKQAEKEARRLEREAKRAQREAEKAAAADRGPVTRTVIQCADDGTVIQVFSSVAEAAGTMGVDKKCIRDAANGKQKHAAGYCWIWEES